MEGQFELRQLLDEGFKVRAFQLPHEVRVGLRQPLQDFSVLADLIADPRVHRPILGDMRQE